MLSIFPIFSVRSREVNSEGNRLVEPGKSVRFKEVLALECSLWRGSFIRAY